MINSLGTLNSDQQAPAPKYPKKTVSPGRGTEGGVFKAPEGQERPTKRGANIMSGAADKSLSELPARYTQLALFNLIY